MKIAVLGLCLVGWSLMAMAAETATTPLAGYTPITTVTDVASLDLDQNAMTILLQISNFEFAQQIYESGAFSGSLSELQLEQPLDTTLPQYTLLQGTSIAGDTVHGWLYETALKGTDLLYFQYAANDSPDDYLTCLPRAYPVPRLDGCLNQTGQLLSIDASQPTFQLEYTWTPLDDGFNTRTLKSLSTDAEAQLFRCRGRCPYHQYSKYYAYYGSFDYAHQWMTAAFARQPTQFTRGNANFALLQNQGEGHAAVLSHATVYLHVYMHIVRELEHAIDLCQCYSGVSGSCQPHDSQIPVGAWDQAVALYVGSLPGPDGDDDGQFLYSLAEERCTQFNTCIPEEEDDSYPQSRVNRQIMNLFAQGQVALQDALDCGAAQDYKNDILKYMTVPLVQSTLLYAYKLERVRQQDDPSPDNVEAIKARATVFAAALLPLIHHENSQDAQALYEELALHTRATQFEIVQQTLEPYYSIWGITCDDVGGIYSTERDEYLVGPCGGGHSRSKVGLGVGLGMAVLAILVACGCWFGCFRRSSQETPLAATAAMWTDYQDHPEDEMT